MVNAKEFFESNFIKAENIKGGEICEINGKAETAEIPQKDKTVKTVLNVPVLMDGKDRIFTPNKTNGDTMVEAFGEDSDLWVGKKFTLKLADTIAFGKKTKTMLVEPLVPKKV